MPNEVAVGGGLGNAAGPRGVQSGASATPMVHGVRIPAMDGLRGLAILLVMAYHFDLYGPVFGSPALRVDRVFLRAVQSGWIGVDLFFVLSGFLITGILYDSTKSRHYFRDFYARRSLRIFPLYFATLAFFFLVLPRLLPAHAGLQSAKDDAIWYLTYLTNQRIAQSGWPQFVALAHFWSLAVEEQFYLFWPWLVAFLRRGALMRLAIVLTIWSLVARVALWTGGNDGAAYVLTGARLDSLGIGALLALGIRSEGGLARLAPWARPAALVSGAALGILFVWRHGFSTDDRLLMTVGLTLIAVFFGSLLLLVLVSSPRSIVARLFSSSSLSFLGRYSYALYVFHHPLLFFVPSWLGFERLPTVLGSQIPARLLFAGAAGAVSIGIALASWHLCEKHFLRLKQYFYHEPESQAQRRPAVAADMVPQAGGAQPAALHREISPARRKAPNARFRFPAVSPQEAVVSAAAIRMADIPPRHHSADDGVPPRAKDVERSDERRSSESGEGSSFLL